MVVELVFAGMVTVTALLTCTKSSPQPLSPTPHRVMYWTVVAVDCTGETVTVNSAGAPGS